MENPRTDAARDHDDSGLTEDRAKTPSEQGRSGGNLARDVATDAALARLKDPEAHSGVEKSDAIDHGTATERRRRGDG